jgi:hypothetical protein
MTVLSCHRCLIKTGVEKMNTIYIQIIALTTSGLYYKRVTIVIDVPSVVKVMLHIVASLTIVIDDAS